MKLFQINYYIFIDFILLFYIHMWNEIIDNSNETQNAPNLQQNFANKLAEMKIPERIIKALLDRWNIVNVVKRNYPKKKAEIFYKELEDSENTLTALVYLVKWNFTIIDQYKPKKEQILPKITRQSNKEEKAFNIKFFEQNDNDRYLHWLDTLDDPNIIRDKKID